MFPGKGWPVRGSRMGALEAEKSPRRCSGVSTVSVVVVPLTFRYPS